MAEFLSNPSSLTKDMLKRALVANNVALPNGDQRKEVYVELYLRNLTSQNRNRGSAQAFSSDEEPSASTTVRAGRKATRKTDRVRPVELDMSDLTDDELKERLLKYGVNTGPIVASTRKVYEKKLQKFLDRGPPQTTTIISTSESLQMTNSSRNGNSDSDQYSDKEEGTAAVSEPALELEPEPVPVVERPLWIRAKTQVTTRTRSSQRKIEKLSAVEQNPKTSERDLLKELFPHEDFNMPTGISATCRQPIKGAAGRPFSDAWHESLRPRLTEHRYTTSSYTESSSAPRINVAAPPSTHLSAPKHAAPPSVQTKSRRRVPVWVQLLLFAAVAGFLLFIYQAMENNQTSPFGRPNPRDGLETAPK